MPLQSGCFVPDAPVQPSRRQTTRQSLGLAISLFRAGAGASRASLPAVSRARSALRRSPILPGADPSAGQDLRSAIARHEHALRLIPDLAEARNNLGVILQSQGRIDDAEACFREALKHEPDYAERTITWATRCKIRGGSRRPRRLTGKPFTSGQDTLPLSSTWATP